MKPARKLLERCTDCDRGRLHVVSTFRYEERIVRYRKCDKCGSRFRSEERLVDAAPKLNKLRLEKGEIRPHRPSLSGGARPRCEPGRPMNARCPMCAGTARWVRTTRPGLMIVRCDDCSEPTESICSAST